MNSRVSAISGISLANPMISSDDKTSSDKTPNKFRISESEVINEDQEAENRESKNVSLNRKMKLGVPQNNYRQESALDIVSDNEETETDNPSGNIIADSN